MPCGMKSKLLRAVQPPAQKSSPTPSGDSMVRGDQGNGIPLSLGTRVASILGQPLAEVDD